MSQKMIQVGNSYAVTISKPFLESIGAVKDTVITAQHDIKKKRVTLDFMNEEEVIDEVVDPEVYKVAKQLLNRYLPAFKELAKR